MSIDQRQLLGFAFAAADLVVEMSPEGRVALALGAAQTVLGARLEEIQGADWLAQVVEDDRPLVEAMFIAVEDGQRRAYAPVRLRNGRSVALHARVLPDNGGRISCALNAAPPPRTAATADGLYPRQEFESLARDLTEAARATGAQLELTFVELGGLAGVAEPVRRRAIGALRLEAEGGCAAAGLTPERFALLRRKDDDPQSLARRVSRAVAAIGDPAAGISAAAQGVPLETLSPARLHRALHLALEDFATEGLKDAAPATLAEAMNRSVRRTLARAGELGAAVSQRKFTLAFQPVVELASGMAHHHEVLVRFENGHSPFALVRMAEEFDLIEELDRAVVDQTVRRLKADRTGAERLAVNISGRTITSPGFIETIETLISKDSRLKGRLLFEITESAAIDDLALAQAHVQRLQGLGSLVCLDDFGAGSASLGYLQKLHVDIVKIDGRYVRDLVAGGRDAALVAHVVNLCRELDIRTVAEMVETAEVEAAVRGAGVDFAQGWLYGRPADVPEPAAARAAPTPRLRRAGAGADEWR